MKTIALRFDFEPAALPVNGRTPAARHASWTGAQAAGARRGENLLELLDWFARCRRMTFADFCKFMAVDSQHRLCSTWNAAKYELEWIRGTGEFESYITRGRLVHREIHVITAKGRRAAFEKLRATVAQIEGRP